VIKKKQDEPLSDEQLKMAEVFLTSTSTASKIELMTALIQEGIIDPSFAIELLGLNCSYAEYVAKKEFDKSELGKELL
jgi:hypothetical protein